MAPRKPYPSNIGREQFEQFWPAAARRCFPLPLTVLSSFPPTNDSIPPAGKEHGQKKPAPEPQSKPAPEQKTIQQAITAYLAYGLTRGGKLGYGIAYRTNEAYTHRLEKLHAETT